MDIHRAGVETEKVEIDSDAILDDDEDDYYDEYEEEDIEDLKKKLNAPDTGYTQEQVLKKLKRKSNPSKD